MDLKCPIHGLSFPGGSDSKAYAYNVGDLGSIPVTHANFYSNNHLSLNISITLRRGPPNVPMQVFRYPREKKRKLQQNMIKLAKIKSKAVSVLKEHTHYNFLVKTKQKPKNSMGTIFWRDSLGSGSWGFRHTISTSLSKRSFQSLHSREGHKYSSGLSSPLGVRENIGEHRSYFYVGK